MKIFWIRIFKLQTYLHLLGIREKSFLLNKKEMDEGDQTFFLMFSLGIFAKDTLYNPFAI